MKTFLVVLAALALAALLTTAVVGFGLVEVAATEPHSPPVEWLLATARERAIVARADDVVVPPLDDARLLGRGIGLYQRHCVACHGAPGVDPSPWAWGLNPFPPPLHEPPELSEGHAARTFWVTANGIRMSGMPAFGVTLTEEELWAVTALVERLGELSGEEYTAMIRAGDGAGAGAGASR